VIKTETGEIMLFEINDNDKKIYETEIEPYLPDRIIDIHTHLWLDKYKRHEEGEFNRVVSWPSLVAKDNSVEDLDETYRIMFPGKQVSALCFSSIKTGDDFEALNGYVGKTVSSTDHEGLLFTPPWWPADELERRVKEGGFKGIKVYLNLSPDYIPQAEIRIFDFLTREHLRVIDRHGWIVMLHIPRHGRLKDPVNLHQILEIEQEYPNARVIIAHVGRAYCKEDVGNAFEVLRSTQHIKFDFSANTNRRVFEQLIDSIDSNRILFGSDLPITRMRMRRICENGKYINIVPPGLYGDVSTDSNMREADTSEAAGLTFFMYEELRAFIGAARDAGLTDKDFQAIFYGNARRLLDEAGKAN
jgi:predicted TIM-barrel fold metal-dependent hydrolase